MTQEQTEFRYDVCLSFAGEDRPYVRQVADALRSMEIKVFYDEYERSDLWGRDLYTHLDNVYRRMARYCIIFISQHYAKKLWTNHERQSAQARAFGESEEYLLPVRFDDSEIPGIRPTVGYLDLRIISPSELASLIAEKLGPPIRTAVLIDGDWLLAVAGIPRSAARIPRSKVDFSALMTGLRSAFGDDAEVFIQLVDRGNTKFTDWLVAELKRTGYIVETIKSVKASGFNERLILRSIGLPPNFRTLVLLSGDSDLIPLIEHAKTTGRETVLITSMRASGRLREAANRVISLQDMLPDWPERA